MATPIIGLVNLTESSLEQPPVPPQESELGAVAKPISENSTATTAGDEFTPSAPAADPVAGLFTVNQVSPFSPAANALLSPAAALAPATPAKPTANAAPAVGTTPTTTAQQLQILNTALEALGLDSADISSVDLLASLTNDFSPTAFSSLAYQLQAQQGALQVAAANAVIATVPEADAKAASAASASPSFHLQEVLVRFPLVGGQKTTSALQLTLVDNSGNALVALSPAQPASLDAPSRAIANASQTKAATA
ncbi:MAG: hypothetical protein ABSG16_06325 [Candidatus Acidiferrum sp.]